MSIIKLFPELKSYKAEDFERLRFEKPVLMVAMTARTGSTHLCSALSSVIDAPIPDEIFNTRGNIQCQLKQRNVSNFHDYLKSILQDSGEYFIFKTSWNDFSYFRNVYQSMFPNLNVLYLNRLDIEKQAVSLYKAKISGMWHDTKAKIKITSKEKPSNDFNVKAICNCINELESEKSEWESFFSAEGLSPVRVNYEDFEYDIESAVDYIFRNFDIDKKKKLVVSDYHKLSDELSEKWVKALKEYRLSNVREDLPEGLM